LSKAVVEVVKPDGVEEVLRVDETGGEFTRPRRKNLGATPPMFKLKPAHAQSNTKLQGGVALQT
jgi:hypothetical protein